MKFFAENLKYLRNKHNLYQSDLADHLNMRSTSSISEWESGKHTPEVGVLNQLAKYFHVSLKDLMETDLSIMTSNVETVQNMVKIPVLGVISCGEPITASENVNEYIDLPANDLPGGELFYLIAKGDSMSPRIPDGSKVLCRVQPDVETGEIAAILVNDDEEATLKRVRKLNHSTLLEPINEEYDPILINGENQGRIIGKAIQLIVDL